MPRLRVTLAFYRSVVSDGRTVIRRMTHQLNALNLSTPHFTRIEERHDGFTIWGENYALGWVPAPQLDRASLEVPGSKVEPVPVFLIARSIERLQDIPAKDVLKEAIPAMDKFVFENQWHHITECAVADMLPGVERTHAHLEADERLLIARYAAWWNASNGIRLSDQEASQFGRKHLASTQGARIPLAWAWHENPYVLRVELQKL